MATTANATAGLPDSSLRKFNSTFYLGSGRAVLLALPPATAELVLLIAGLCLHGVCLVALVYALVDRRFAPLKAKQIPVLAVSWVASLMWWLGSMQGSGVVRSDGFFASCIWWKLWANYCVGLLTYLSTTIYRLFVQYRVLVMTRPIDTTASVERRYTFFTLLVIYGPLLLLGILGSAIPGGVVTVFPSYYLLPDGSMDLTSACFLNFAIIPVLNILTIIQILVIAYFCWALRNVKKAFNERTQTIVGGALGIATFIFVSIINTIEVSPAASVYLRNVSSWITLLFPYAYFWVVLGYPLYGALFDREACIARFKSELAMDKSSLGTQDKSSSSLPRGASDASKSAPLVKGKSTGKLESDDANRAMFVLGRQVSVMSGSETEPPTTAATGGSTGGGDGGTETTSTTTGTRTEASLG